tara:strand:+ start:56 stop:274 length:219 start_codon:yes stop_codon:yes gene_type:complete
MINNPVNIDSNTNIFIFSKLINTISVATKDKNNEINMGLIKIFKSILLDHLDSIEKNKNIEANITIGINIAL